MVHQCAASSLTSLGLSWACAKGETININRQQRASDTRISAAKRFLGGVVDSGATGTSDATFGSALESLAISIGWFIIVITDCIMFMEMDIVRPCGRSEAEPYRLDIRIWPARLLGWAVDRAGVPLVYSLKPVGTGSGASSKPSPPSDSIISSAKRMRENCHTPLPASPIWHGKSKRAGIDSMLFSRRSDAVQGSFADTQKPDAAIGCLFDIAHSQGLVGHQALGLS